MRQWEGRRRERDFETIAGKGNRKYWSGMDLTAEAETPAVMHQANDSGHGLDFEAMMGGEPAGGDGGQ